jgi:hypothetical protein
MPLSLKKENKNMEQLAASWVFVKGILPGIGGAAISAFIQFKVVKDNSTAFERWATFFCGVLLSHVLGGAAIEHYLIPATSMTATAIKVLTAIFAMSAITQAYIQIPVIITSLRQKFTGN